MEVKNTSTSRGKWFYICEYLIDILIVASTYFLGYRFQRVELFPNNLYDVLISLSSICVISAFVFGFFKTYKCGKKTYLRSLFDILISIIIIAFVGILFDFAIKGIGIWRLTVFYAVILQVGIFVIVKYLTVKLHAAIIKPRDCIIIAKDMNEALKIALKLAHNLNHIYKLKYIINQKADKLYDQLNSSAQIFICSTCDDKPKTQIIKYCAVNSIDCAVIPNMKDIIINSGKANNLKDILLLSMTDKLDIESRFIKRLIDIVFSFVGIVITSPLILFVFLLILLVEKEKPIYKQKRITRYGREFTIYKFRTMVIDAEKQTGAILATRNDKRITKIGRVLRLLRIDELPQLFNVIKGDMSIVGPRPERPDIAEKIIKNLPEFKYRTLVKPGITGYAQVNGRYDTDFKDKLLFDLYYVNNYSLILDFRIMFDTFRVLFIPSLTEGVVEETQIDFEEQFKNFGYSMEYKKDKICFNKNSR